MLSSSGAALFRVGCQETDVLEDGFAVSAVAAKLGAAWAVVSTRQICSTRTECKKTAHAIGLPSVLPAVTYVGITRACEERVQKLPQLNLGQCVYEWRVKPMKDNNFFTKSLTEVWRTHSSNSAPGVVETSGWEASVNVSRLVQMGAVVTVLCLFWVVHQTLEEGALSFLVRSSSHSHTSTLLGSVSFVYRLLVLQD